MGEPEEEDMEAALATALKLVERQRELEGEIAVINEEIERLRQQAAPARNVSIPLNKRSSQSGRL